MFFDAMQNYMGSFCCTWFQVLHGLAVGQLQLFPSFSTLENKISGCNFEFLGTKAYYLQAEKKISGHNSECPGIKFTVYSIL